MLLCIFLYFIKFCWNQMEEQTNMIFTSYNIFFIYFYSPFCMQLLFYLVYFLYFFKCRFTSSSKYWLKYIRKCTQNSLNTTWTIFHQLIFHLNLHRLLPNEEWLAAQSINSTSTAAKLHRKTEVHSKRFKSKLRLRGFFSCTTIL